jgi:cell wall-associated NlpC family hydrolase
MSLSPYIGIPYLNRGSSFQGCDCWGLVWLFNAEELHRLIPRYEGYDDANDSAIMKDYISGRWGAWEEVARDALQIGDVLAVRLGIKAATHCGVYAGNGKMLHTLAGRMSCLESIEEGFWKNAIVRIGRWKS